MKIYTKAGDKGVTNLLFGGKVDKDSISPEAYGSVDELTAALGLLRSEKNSTLYQRLILKIQRELFIVGAELATDKEKEIN